ncbi:MAG TPA: DUF4139 domain-containing protein [Rhodanobacteraceae bacterium]|nr:DUF4139 domain-containing protein [Rhodanobacteraceae bacterium]
MSPKTLAAALAAVLVAPAAFAASGPTLTIYHASNDSLFSGASQGTLDAGHALVHESRALDVTTGNHELRIGGLPATVDPEAISVGFDNGAPIRVLGQRVVLANASSRGALEGAIGSTVSVSNDMQGNALTDPALTGVLVGASDAGLLLRTKDGKLHFVHQYASVTLPADSVSGGSSLLLDVNAQASGKRDARLTYTTSGLGWRAAYKATLAGGSACRMQFEPEASIANRSGRDYSGAAIKLVAGQPNLGDRGIVRFRAASAPAPMAAAAPMPVQASLGDYRSFTLPGTVTLPSGTVTLTPLYATQSLSCERQYIVDDGSPYSPPHPRTSGYADGEYKDRAITSTLAFTAPDALPAGSLRAWIVDHDGAPALLGEGGVADTPKGQRVAVQLGQSFDLRASRERTAFHVDQASHTMDESYRIILSNGGDAARTVTLREHPNRWHEWKVTSSSAKPSRQTPQLLEFEVPVPAHGKVTLDYTIQYAWTAKDL